MNGIYAIHDTLADTLVGGLHLFKHDAPAVRFFGDVAQLPESQIGRHIEDHQLLYLGTLDEANVSITPGYRVVVTGSAWAAARGQQSEDDATQLPLVSQK